MGREQGIVTRSLSVRCVGLKCVHIRGLRTSEAVIGQKGLDEGDGILGLSFEEEEAGSLGLRVGMEK